MLIVIAAAFDRNGEPSVLRLAEFDDKRLKCGKLVEKHVMRYRDFDAAVVIKELASGTKVSGIKLSGGKLMGSNGALTRYKNLRQPSSMSPLVVIARNLVDSNNYGFCVADGNGNVTNMLEDVAVNYAEKHGIANGKIVENAGKKFISSIEGEYVSVVYNRPASVKAPVTPVKPVATPVMPAVTPVIKSPAQKINEDINKTIGSKTPVLLGVPSTADLGSGNKVGSALPMQKKQSTPDNSGIEDYAKLREADMAKSRGYRYINPNGIQWYDGNELFDENTGLTVKEKIALCMMDLKKANLFIHSILASLERVPCNDGEVKTMAVSPFTMTFYYNCNFVNSLSVGQVKFVMIHEAYHILMRHGTREHNRDHRIWNQAGDYYINKLIAEQFGMTRSWPNSVEITANCEFINNPNWEKPSNALSKYIEGLSGILYNPTTNTKLESAESIYEILIDLKKQQQQASRGQQSDQAGDSDEDNKQSGQQGSSDNQQEEGGQQQSDQSGSSQDSGQGDSEEKQDGQSSGQGDSGEKDEEPGEQGGSGSSQDKDEDEQSDGSGGSGSSDDGQADEQEDADGQGGSNKQDATSGNSQGGSGSQKNQQGGSKGQSGGQGSGEYGDDTDSDEGGSDDGYENGDGSGNKQSGNSSNGDKNKSGYAGEQRRPENGNGAAKEVPTEKNGYSYQKEYDLEDVVRDIAEKEGLSGEDLKEALDNIKRAVSNAVAKVRQAGMRVDAAAQRFVNEILKPKVDFRAILRNKLNMQIEYESSWKRPGRRGMLAPGIQAPGRFRNVEDGLTRTVFAIDSSGSRTDEDLAYAFGYIKALCEQMEVELELIFWNTLVSSSYDVKELRDLASVNEIGTGGTDVTCVFKYLKGETKAVVTKNKGTRNVRTDLLIVVTDGYFEDNYGKYRNVAEDVIWILTDRKSYEDFKPLFGIKAPLTVDR